MPIETVVKINGVNTHKHLEQCWAHCKGCMCLVLLLSFLLLLKLEPMAMTSPATSTSSFALIPQSSFSRSRARPLHSPKRRNKQQLQKSPFPADWCHSLDLPALQPHRAQARLKILDLSWARSLSSMCSDHSTSPSPSPSTWYKRYRGKSPSEAIGVATSMFETG